MQIQRTFLTEKGLPERPWFKDQVYAPGAYAGYGAKPIARSHRARQVPLSKPRRSTLKPCA